MVERGFLHRFEGAGPLTWLLAACAGWALLLWLAALLGMGSAVAPTVAITADGSLPKSGPVAPERIGPLAQYSEAASRPVFTPDRRPRPFLATAPGGAASDAQSQPLDFILTGILISPQVRLAILQPSGGGESVRVREGASPEGAAGWRLLSVEPRRAVFQGSGGETSLDLRTFGDAANPSKQVPAGAGAVTGNAAAADADTADQEAAPDAAVPPISAADATRIEAIRRRIEARRAEIRGNASDSGAPAPASAPIKQ